MSSMLSGGAGRAYGFDIENIMMCPSTTSSSRTSHSSSPSSTLSESINSPLAISNRKPRTPRKRPNQTYNEAVDLLSIACPKIFSSKNVKNKNKNLPNKIPLITDSIQYDSELILPIPVAENSGFLLQPGSGFESQVASSYLDFTRSSRGNSLLQDSRVKMSASGPSWPDAHVDPMHAGASCIGFSPSNSGSNELCDGFEDDFDTESMLDEEMKHGIDSIMGVSHATSDQKYEPNNDSCLGSKACYGYPMGLEFGGNLEFNYGMGMRNGIRALKNGDGGNLWSFPVVNISTPVAAATVAPVKKDSELMKRSEPEPELELGHGSKLLKLNYDDVLKAWSDKGSPLPEEVSGSESPGGDIHITKLAQVDLFSENDRLKEPGVVFYKEKKHTHLFSKKIRYQVKKINANRRPRFKGRFVRRPTSPTCEDT